MLLERCFFLCLFAFKWEERTEFYNSAPFQDKKVAAGEDASNEENGEEVKSLDRERRQR